MTSEPAQRKLILYMSMSLDGFAARRDGTMDWLGEKQPHGAHRQRAVAELLGQTGMLVLGRRGGEEMAQAWPSSFRARSRGFSATTTSGAGGRFCRCTASTRSAAPAIWAHSRVAPICALELRSSWRS
mgnify:CR=1 FL=1